MSYTAEYFMHTYSTQYADTYLTAVENAELHDEIKKHFPQIYKAPESWANIMQFVDDYFEIMNMPKLVVA